MGDSKTIDIGTGPITFKSGKGKVDRPLYRSLVSFTDLFCVR